MLILGDFEYFLGQNVENFSAKNGPPKKSRNISPLILCDTFISAVFMAWGRSLREIVLSGLFSKKKTLLLSTHKSPSLSFKETVLEGCWELWELLLHKSIHNGPVRRVRAVEHISGCPRALRGLLIPRQKTVNISLYTCIHVCLQGSQSALQFRETKLINVSVFPFLKWEHACSSKSSGVL